MQFKVVEPERKGKMTQFKHLAGWAAKKTAKHSWCNECSDSLGSQQHKAHSTFFEMKDRGWLFEPTESVIAILVDRKEIQEAPYLYQW